MLVTAARALEGMRVLELGSRIGVGACGRILADAGAEVIVVEPRTRQEADKWQDRPLATAGKHSLAFEPTRPDDCAVLEAAAWRCDVVLTSSDVDVALHGGLRSALDDIPIACDITAFGATGPLAGIAASELDLQAMSGLADTTGFRDGDPVAIRLPIVELLTGLYGAVSTAIAWRVMRRDGVGQRIEVAMLDTAINALTTFLPAHFAGRPSRRLGNGHSLSCPWNAYRARDGWVVVCSSTDAHWRGLASVIAPALADDPRYALLADRLARRGDVDALVACWVAERTIEATLDALQGTGVAAAPIVPVAALSGDANLALRGTLLTAVDPVTGRSVRLPASLLPAERGAASVTIPEPDSVRSRLSRTPRRRTRQARSAVSRPLAGVRVLEIGQYTTAPLATRHLASFGADVIKIEPEGGDIARLWTPARAGTSHFFKMTNGSKRSVALDLRGSAGRACFRDLLAHADVLVENMKPGSLANLGFDYDTMQSINPRLVYCAISGFGARSAYPGRPAFDMVVQAMSGIMEANGSGEQPLKVGASIADIAGAQTGLFAVIAALEQRERTGRGSMVDIAMQDIGAWLTQSLWSGLLRLPASTREPADIAAALAHPQVVARELVVARVDEEGTAWEMLGSPMKLALTPPLIGPPLGAPAAGGIGWIAPSPTRRAAMPLRA